MKSIVSLQKIQTLMAAGAAQILLLGVALGIIGADASKLRDVLLVRNEYEHLGVN